MVDACTYSVSALGQVAAYALQTDERLIDAVNLLRRTQASSQAHHAIAHVAVQREICTEGYQPITVFHVPYLKPGRSHLDAQCLGFITTGNSATIVVAEHHHRTPIQGWSENPLTAHIKIVAVYQREHWSLPCAQLENSLILPTTTPHTSMVWLSLGTMSGYVGLAARSLMRPVRW